MTWQWRQTANKLLKWPNAAEDLGPEDSAITDDGSTVTSTEPVVINIASGTHFTLTDGTDSYEFEFASGELHITGTKQIEIISSVADAPLLTERVTTVTNAGRSSYALRLKTSGDMTDGFGPIYTFIIMDDAGVSNVIGEMFCTRDGADNSGRYQFAVYDAGTLSRRIIANPTGVLVGTGILSTTAPAAPLHGFRRDAGTADVQEVAIIERESSGTAAAGLGARLAAYLESSTTARQLAGAIDWIWTTATHASRTAKLAFSLVSGGTEAVYMTLYSTYLDHTHVYGSMYQDDTATVITVSATNTDYIVTGMSGGSENQMTFQAAKEIKALVAGKYKIDWQVSFRAAAANQEIEGAVGINGTRQANTSAHHKIGTATDDVTMSGTGIITLAVNDLVQIVVRNETATQNITVDHANLSLVRVGG